MRERIFSFSTGVLKSFNYSVYDGIYYYTYLLMHPLLLPEDLANFCYDDGSSRENLPWLDVLAVPRPPGCSTCHRKLLK